MKPEQISQHLKELAEKLGIKVSEQNFTGSPIPVKSGYCKVKDQDWFILDKNLPLNKKNRILASFLNRFPTENLYVVPKVREFLEWNR